MDEKTLNDLLECSVCLDRLNSSSKVLPCQHTFCRKCLEIIYASRRELRCPECRILVETKIEDLPPNVLLMRILEGLKTSVTAERTYPVEIPSDHVKNVPAGEHLHKLSKDETEKTFFLHSSTIRMPANLKKPQSALNDIPHGIALYDYESKEAGTLRFKRDDIIRLKQKLDSLWYIGEVQNREGIFPINLIHVRIPLPVATCVALYDFQMAPKDEEEGCLSFTKGTIINVLRRVDNNWVEGQIGRKIGIFPLEFVELNKTAIDIIKSSRNLTKNILSNLPCASAIPADYANNNNVTLRNKELPLRSSNNTRRHSLNNIQSDVGSSMLVNSLSHLNCNSMEILSNDRDSNTNPGSTAKGLNKHTLLSQPPCLPWAYMALYPYKPRKNDELELKKGGVYLVIQRCLDGWYKGVNCEDTKGVFPGNYVIPLKANEQHHLLSTWKTNFEKIQANKILNPLRERMELPTQQMPLCKMNSKVVASTKKSLLITDKSTRYKTPTIGCLPSSLSNAVSNASPTSTSSTTINGLRKFFTQMKTRSKSPNSTIDVECRGQRQRSIDSFLANDIALENSVNLQNTRNVHHSRSGSCPSQLLTDTISFNDAMAMPTLKACYSNRNRIGEVNIGAIICHHRQNSLQQFNAEQCSPGAAAVVSDGTIRTSHSTLDPSYVAMPYFYRKDDKTSVK